MAAFCASSSSSRPVATSCSSHHAAPLPCMRAAAPLQQQQASRQRRQQRRAVRVVVAAAVVAAAACCEGVEETRQPGEHVAPPEQPDPNAASLQELSFSHRHSLLDKQGRLMLKNLTFNELQEWCSAEGEDARRAKQLWRWMYYDGAWAASFAETVGRQNGLSSGFASKAEGLASVDGGLLLREVVAAQDGTRKLVFELTEGPGAGGSVEAVLIPMLHRRGTRRHITLCVSSQVGCAMNCQFCYTGRMGLSGSLSTAQIVEQMVIACRLVASEDEGAAAADRAAITNVVFMGQGEPLDNMESVLAAVHIMTHPLGLHMSRHKVTVSTVGLIDKLERFAADPAAPQLALSLHATTDAVRDWIVPVNRRAKLPALVAALRRHYPAGNAAGRRVLIEYTMLSGVNDSQEDAARLVELLAGVEAKVNLITFNPWAGTRFLPSPIERVKEFRSVLVRGGRVCTIRDSRGDDTMAACGQLGSPAPSAKAAPILQPPAQFEAALAPPAVAQS